jgi:alanine dehydrogenase
MRVCIPRETKDGERRVALDPAAVAVLVGDGHEVCLERGAGEGIGAGDGAYAQAGAALVQGEAAWHADLVVKVKEIQPGEWTKLARGCTLFSFQQFVGAPGLVREVAARGVSAIAYELVRSESGGFPLLAPMSVIAGRLAIQVGAQLLTLPAGGNGTLLAGAPGVPPPRVLVLGAGHAGTNAARVASALGAEVTLLTRSGATRDAVRAELGPRVRVDLATADAIERHALEADLVVGAVFVPGAPTPKLLPRSLVAGMRRGSVIVDISIDAGGVAETSRPTTHSCPTFVEEGVIHYCVANMPAAVARASAQALSAAVLPYARALAAKGVARAVRESPDLRSGVVLWHGRAVHEAIAREAGLACIALSDSELAPP